MSAARKTLDDIGRRPLPDFPRPTWAAMDRGFSVGLLRDAAVADERALGVSHVESLQST